MYAYFIRDTDSGKLVAGNHSGTILCFIAITVADTEADYLNNKSPSAPLRERYVVEKKTILDRGGVHPSLREAA